MFHHVLVLLLSIACCVSVFFLSSVSGDADTVLHKCWPIDISGRSTIQPCIHVSITTCGDIGLHGWFSLDATSTNITFNIRNPSDLNNNICFTIPNLSIPVCNKFCLQLDATTFKLTRSYASFTPYIAISNCPLYPRFPRGDLTTYSLGIDCDIKTNTTCGECTYLSDQGICGWCPTTNVCVATTSLTSSICDGLNMCPNAPMKHMGDCEPPTLGPTIPPPTQPPRVNACANPMFMGPLQLTGKTLQLLPQPQRLNGASCSNLEGQQHCCDYSTLQDWIDAMHAFDQAAIISAADRGNLQLEDLIDMLHNTSIPIPYFPNPTDQQKNLLKRLLKIFRKMDQPIQNCVKATVAYWNGLMCFACHTNWRDFYTPESGELRLNQSTCDAATTQCKPVLDLLNDNRDELMGIMIDLYTEYAQTTGNHQYDALKDLINNNRPLISLLPHICQIGWPGYKSCSDVICKKFLHGLDYNGFTPPTFGLIRYAQTSSSSSPVDPLSWLIPSLTHHGKHHVIHAVMGFILSWVQHVDRTTKGHVAQLYDYPPTNGHAIPVYTPNGYPATEIGCAAQMSTQACSPTPITPLPPDDDDTDTSNSTKSNMGLIIGIGVGVVIGLIALIGVICYVRKRNSTRVPPHRRLQDEDALGEVATSPNGSAYSRFDPRL